jgi:hypothetical protein
VRWRFSRIVSQAVLKLGPVILKAVMKVIPLLKIRTFKIRRCLQLRVRHWALKATNTG